MIDHALKLWPEDGNLSTKTAFRRAEYGDTFIDCFFGRVGLGVGADELFCLRSVIMDPYVAHTTDGDYFAQIIEIVRKAVTRLTQEVKKNSPR